MLFIFIVSLLKPCHVFFIEIYVSYRIFNKKVAIFKKKHSQCILKINIIIISII